MERILRWICVWSMIPAFILNLCYGLLYGSLLPPLGLIPLGFSVAISLYNLELFRPGEYSIILGSQPKRIKTRVLLDLLAGIAILICTVFSFIVILARDTNSYGYYCPATGDYIASGMLGTFSILPYLVNM
jgi:hypothetical protein